MRAALITLVIFLALAAAVSCDENGSGGANPDALTGEIAVFTAASLTDAFTDVGEVFRGEYPGTTLTFNFAGSQELRAQLEQGARADIFASANQRQMDLSIDAGLIAGESQIFTKNRLVVIVPETNEAGIETLQDLANPGLKIVLAGPEVPVGEYSRQYLELASADPQFDPDYGTRVLSNLVSEEPNVKQVVAKVQLGEADAGIVYTSDVTPAVSGSVTAIDIPDHLNQVAAYPIAVATEASEPELARLFIDFLRSEEGQAILVKHGFLEVGE